MKHKTKKNNIFFVFFFSSLFLVFSSSLYADKTLSFGINFGLSPFGYSYSPYQPTSDAGEEITDIWIYRFGGSIRFYYHLIWFSISPGYVSKLYGGSGNNLVNEYPDKISLYLVEIPVSLGFFARIKNKYRFYIATGISILYNFTIKEEFLDVDTTITKSRANAYLPHFLLGIELFLSKKISFSLEFIKDFGAVSFSIEKNGNADTYLDGIDTFSYKVNNTIFMMGFSYYVF
jgi:hypothetical protein